MEISQVQTILTNNKNNRSGIITMLQEIQEIYNYLPEEALKYVAQEINIPIIDLYSIASFYDAFSLTPRGKYVCRVCMGTACHVRGASLVLDEMEKKLNLREGGTTPDYLFSLKTVNCLGACALGPIVQVNENYHGNMSIQKVDEILAKYDFKPEQ